MAEYCGIVQNMVRVGRNLYSLSFRVQEAGTEENSAKGMAEGAVYSAEIEFREDGFAVIPGEKLDECMKLVSECPGPMEPGIAYYDKRIVGIIADKIFGRIKNDRTLQVRSWVEV